MRAIEFAELDRQTTSNTQQTLAYRADSSAYSNMAASAAAARCLRVMPSMVCVSRMSAPSAKTTVAGALLRRNGGLQGGLPETDHAKWESSVDLLAGLRRSVDGVGVNSAVISLASVGSPPVAVPTMEAVNRNARRPKKVREAGIFATAVQQQ